MTSSRARTMSFSTRDLDLLFGVRRERRREQLSLGELQDEEFVVQTALPLLRAQLRRTQVDVRESAGKLSHQHHDRTPIRFNGLLPESCCDLRRGYLQLKSLVRSHFLADRLTEHRLTRLQKNRTHFKFDITVTLLNLLKFQRTRLASMGSPVALLASSRCVPSSARRCRSSILLMRSMMVMSISDWHAANTSDTFVAFGASRDV